MNFAVSSGSAYGSENGTQTEAVESVGEDLYKKSGVDIAAGEALVRALSPFAGASQRTGAACHLGGFGGIFDLKAIMGEDGYQDPLLVAATDGVGTKLLLAQKSGTFDGLGQDLVAMCVNDLIAQGAEPLFFLDYIACGKLEPSKMAAIVQGISRACQASGCGLVGGETAEMPQAYTADAFDLAGFAVGAVERERLLPNENENDAAQAGDIVLGLASNGVHSNGFSLVRQVLDQSNIIEKEPHIIDTLLKPTRLYVKPMLALLNSALGKAVRGIAHITGGGLIENPPRSLPNKALKIVIDYDSWTMPEIFCALQTYGSISDEEMRRVFNCGIGMTLIVAADKADAVKATLETLGEKVFAIGRVTAQ